MSTAIRSRFSLRSFALVAVAAIVASAGTAGSASAAPLRAAVTPSPLYIGTSGNWWGQSHWNALAGAVGHLAGPVQFGRSPWDEKEGVYDAAAITLQQYLNSNDGGKTSDIRVDGYWGPITTEKLRAVIDLRCGQSPKLGISGAIDGKAGNGTTWIFNQDEAAALAKCLNDRRF